MSSFEDLVGVATWVPNHDFTQDPQSVVGFSWEDRGRMR